MQLEAGGRRIKVRTGYIFSQELQTLGRVPHIYVDDNFWWKYISVTRFPTKIQIIIDEQMWTIIVNKDNYLITIN